MNGEDVICRRRIRESAQRAFESSVTTMGGSGWVILPADATRAASLQDARGATASNIFAEPRACAHVTISGAAIHGRELYTTITLAHGAAHTLATLMGYANLARPSVPSHS